MRTEPRPPFTKRLRPGHWASLDILVATVLALILFSVYFRAGAFGSFPAVRWFAHLWLAMLFAAAMCVPVAFRRRNAVVALVWVLTVSVVTEAIYVARVELSFVAIALVLYMVAATCRRKVSAAALAVALGLLTVEYIAAGGLAFGGSIVPIDLVVIIAWTIGYAARQRRSYAARLQYQAASSAVTEERLRIARELHDVVAHSMTVVAVQAGFGHHVIDTQPAQARAALGAIQATSREALTEMQRLLGVLRQADPHQTGPTSQPGHRRGTDVTGKHDLETTLTAPPGPPLLPAPGLADLDRLAARTADAGVQVDLHRTGRLRDIPAGIDLSAYRIVQEALTNVVKHAGATTCDVTVDYGDEHLRIEVTDDGPGGVARAAPGTCGAVGATADGTHVGWPGPPDGPPAATGRGVASNGGHGIIGMRERVLLYSGEFSAAPRAGQGFRVTARLPLTGGTG